MLKSGSRTDMANRKRIKSRCDRTPHGSMTEGTKIKIALWRFRVRQEAAS